MGYSIGRGRDAHAPRGCAWAELTGREGLCRKDNDEGDFWGKVRNTGKQKSRNAVGLAGQEEYLN